MYNGGKEAETMVAHINNPELNADLGHACNEVTTSQYTALNFLPKNLTMQFSRLANVYFLLISVLQLLPFSLSPTNRFATAGPFAIILCLSMARELWEDSKRHTADAEVNGRLATVVRSGGELKKVRWADLVVGDIILVSDGDELPADLVLLSTGGGEEGGCYIDSCNLDGETNLKGRTALEATRGAGTPARASQLGGRIEYEPANSRLYSFNGRYEQGGGVGSGAVDNENVLLRGSVLRNTPWVMGLIVYVGASSKIMMNAKKSTPKQSSVEKTVNRLLVSVLMFELISVTCCTMGMYVEIHEHAPWYLPYVSAHGNYGVLAGWFTFLILLNNYVPISLYISLEIAHTVQGLQMDWDLEMYHEASDTPALTRTTNLNEELGQVEYVFSDKTGTLTQNVMVFRKCWVAGPSEGHAYGFGTTEIGHKAERRDPGQVEAHALQGDADAAQYHRSPVIDFDDPTLLHDYSAGVGNVGEFISALSVAQTVVPEGWIGEGDPNIVRYMAESPDEGALLDWARCMGWFFHSRTQHSITVRVHGKDLVYTVLNVNKFTSARGRMSVVVRLPAEIGGQVVVYCKGADSVMYGRIVDCGKLALEGVVGGYASEGLRTLVVARKVLSEGQWQAFDARHKAACSALEHREEALDAAAGEVETGMELLGVTAIEDKLQDGVPDTIASLAKAGVKLWVLTGDKRETAENIGYACQVLREGMHVHRVDGCDEETVRSQLSSMCSDMGSRETAAEKALVIEGCSLLVIFADKDGRLEEELLELARDCDSVMCCRASPSQKRQVVAMVRTGVVPEPITLAIGDGANDVPMILEAHVGVGISGNEGMQAVRSSDYAVAQFRFLKRLMLVHGRTNYRRASVLILYSLYKQMAMVTCLLLFSPLADWSGTALFDSFILTGFNTLYTFLPPIIFACLDQDVPPELAMAYPHLYFPGQRGENLNSLQLATWSLNGLAHCAAATLISVACFGAAGDETLSELGTAVMWSLAMACNVRMLLEMRNVSLIAGLCLAISGFAFFLWALLLSNTWSSMRVGDNYCGVAGQSFSNPIVWLSVICSTIVMGTYDVVMIYGHRQFFPDPTYIVQEMGMGYDGSQFNKEAVWLK